MKVFGNEITIDEAERLFDIISNRLNKDKEALCLGLEIICRDIENWHNDVVSRFSVWQKNGMKVEISQLNEIVQYAQGSKRRSAVERSVIFLRYVTERHMSRKLRRLDRLDINKIDEIRRDLEYFRDTVVDFKGIWMHEALEKGRLSDPGVVVAWENGLDATRRRINEAVASLQLHIGCDQQKVKELFQQERKEE